MTLQRSTAERRSPYTFVFRRTLEAVALLAALAGVGTAQPVTDRGASIVVLPKIVSDEANDTIIQITNISDLTISARCFYVSTAAFCSLSRFTSCVTDADCAPAGGSCVPQIEFDLFLTPQQPTFWLAGQGRGALFSTDQGVINLIPPVPFPFKGELLCVQTDAANAPIAGNSLIGQATLSGPSGDIAKYHAIGLAGNPTVNGDNTLVLGQEYAACPQTWLLSHLADGAEDSLLGTGSSVHTNLTIAPCSLDLTSPAVPPLNVSFTITNEFEQPQSFSTTVTSWDDVPMANIDAFTRSTLGSDYAQTQIVSAGGSGILALAQEFHRAPATDAQSSATVNAHSQGQQITPDQIVLPPTSPPPRGVQALPVPASPAGLQGITVGPDGNLWFTEGAANQIGRITLEQTINEFPIPTQNSAPAAITTGPDGNLWFTEGAVNQLGRLAPDGASIREFPIPSSATSITSGPDGNLWFTEPATNHIGRITTDGSPVVEYAIPTASSQPSSITSGPDGNLWFTETAANRIGRITADGASVVEFVIPTAGSQPSSIVAGPDHNLWFVETAVNQIGRIATDGSFAEFSIRFAVGPSAGPASITVGPDQSLWFSESGCALGRITTDGLPTIFASHGFCGPGGAAAPAMTTGPDGGLWLVIPGDRGVIERLLFAQ